MRKIFLEFLEKNHPREGDEIKIHPPPREATKKYHPLITPPGNLMVRPLINVFIHISFTYFFVNQQSFPLQFCNQNVMDSTNM